MTDLRLAHDLGFEDLYRPEGLARIDRLFLEGLDADLRGALEAGRAAPASLVAKAESELLLAVAPHFEDFLAKLFGIEAEVRDLAARHNKLAPLFTCKRLFVQRRALKGAKPEELASLDADALLTELGLAISPFDELAFANAVQGWQADEAANAGKLEKAARYAAWATLTEAGKARHRKGVLF
jgi:hypothetical protein